MWTRAGSHLTNGVKRSRNKTVHRFAHESDMFAVEIPMIRSSGEVQGIGGGIARGPTLKMDLQTTSRTKRHIVGLKC